MTKDDRTPNDKPEAVDDADLDAAQGGFGFRTAKHSFKTSKKTLVSGHQDVKGTGDASIGGFYGAEIKDHSVVGDFTKLKG